MRLVWMTVGQSLAVALLAACPAKDDGTPNPSATDGPVTDTDGPSGPPSSTADELTTITPTEPGPTTTPATTTSGPPPDSTDTTATATDSTDTAATATDSSTDTVAATTDSDTGEFLECPVPDADTDATFAVTLTDWPGAWTEAHFIDVMCTVDAVTLEGGMVVTALTCDHEGVPRPATVSIRPAPEGDVTWAAGDSVRLDSMALDDEVSLFTRAVTMRSPDKQELLLVAVDGAEDEPTRFAPLLYSIAKFCDSPPWDGDAGALATVTLEIPLGAALSLDSGKRGSFPLDAGRVYAFDLAEAVVGACCHGSDILQLLVRRVAVDG